jgi:dipicolinate synthase subunit A
MRVFGGKLEPQAARLEQFGVPAIDYLCLEEMAAANAVPTAEGAIQLAMQELPVTIQGSDCLVIGWGRIGKVLSAKLAALGARVTVSARREQDVALLRALGYRADVTARFYRGLGGYDLIVNTVPAGVLGRRELEQIRHDCVVIDLASKPGGVDWDAASQLNRTVIWALSLPGKVAPVSAGRIIRDAILSYLDLR